ncbi:MAG: hypothetical protein EA380_04035 [Phycisphaeraceae bacterium]|nr:MAG: hypothetical protein EA380_04035 [Phycisphaeraceae bacterium]
MNQRTTSRSIRIKGYDFEGPYTHTANLRNAAGVYVVLDYRSDEKWWVIDVGESEDVRARIESHDRKSCWERHRQGTLGVAVLYTSGWTAEQRRQLESQIRIEYTPPCGDR